MRDHVRILGILNLVIGCLGALAGVIVLLIFGGLAGIVGVSATDSDALTAIPILTVIGVTIAILLCGLALPAIIGGWGLLHFRPWARTLMIIVSVLHLFHIPIGTALGVYGLWVLLNDEAKPLFDGHLIAPGVPAPPATGSYATPPSSN